MELQVAVEDSYAGTQKRNQWKDIFAADPKSINDLEKKFSKIAATFPLSSGDGLVCHVVEGVMCSHFWDIRRRA